MMKTISNKTKKKISTLQSFLKTFSMNISKFTKMSIFSFLKTTKAIQIFWVISSKSTIYPWVTVFQKWWRNYEWKEWFFPGIQNSTLPETGVSTTTKKLWKVWLTQLLTTSAPLLLWKLDNSEKLLKATTSKKKDYWEASIWNIKVRVVTGPLSWNYWSSEWK